MFRKIFSNVIFLTISQASSWVLAAIYILVVPRYLGPAGVGLLALVGAMGSIIAVLANAGTRLYILREVARNPEASRRLVGPAVLISIAIGLLSWLVVIIIVNLTGQSETFKTVVYIWTISGIFSYALGPVRATLQGLDKMSYSLYETLIDKGLGTVVAVALAALNFGVVMIASTSILVAIPLVILNCYWFFRFSHMSFRGGLPAIKELLGGGFAFLLVDISFNAYLYLDAILLANLTNETVVGYYSVPTRLFGSLMAAPVILGQAVLPSLSRLAVDEHKQEEGHELSRHTLHFLICISLPIAVGTTVMAEPLINFFYQGQFAPSIPIMIILGWTVLPTYLGIGLYQILVAQGRQAGWTKLNITGAVANLSLNLLLIPYFQNNFGNGGIGAALSLLITESIIAAFALRMVGPKVLNARLGWNALKSFGVAAFMGLLILPLQHTFLAIPIFLGVLIYGLLSLIAFNQFKQVKVLVLKAKNQLTKPKKEEAVAQGAEL